VAFDGGVLLIEADLRRPSLAAVRGLRQRPGLSEVLSGQCDYSAAIQKVEVSVGTNGSTSQRWFDVLVAGPIPPNPGELIEGDRMTKLMAQATASYDFVVVDCGPALMVPDALALMTQVAGVLVVSHVGGNTRDAAVRLRDQLSAANIQVLGLVANRVKQSPEAGYYYGYSAETD
jgi:capsular exopolysaccharide synthesis family protein